MVTAVYPGTFDPITRGHEDLVRRAAGIFDEIVVAVADSRAKGTLFDREERLELAASVLVPLGNVRIEGFSGLLKDFVERVGGRVVTLFMAPTDGFQFVSGTLVREIAMFGGDVSRFVPGAVNERLIQKRRQRAEGR
jgi:pantetheine-phosphate adenylyltransferase